MHHGVTVYAPDGVTEVFSSATRTFKIIKRIPFSRALRFSTTLIQDPLFATEDPVWFWTRGTMYNDLIDVTFSGDTASVKVTTFYRSPNRDGSDRYEVTDPDPWPEYDGEEIIIGVY